MTGLLAMLAVGCFQAHLPEDKDAIFTVAVEASEQEKWTDAANASWAYLQSTSTDDPRYDRGLKLLAQANENLGLVWSASLFYKDIAKARRNLDIVPDSIRSLERIVQSGVYDEDTVVTAFLASEEFTTLPPEVQAFVDYYKGLDLARRGRDDWAEAQFVRIVPTSPYAERAEYVRGVQQVALGNYQAAIAVFTALAEREQLDPGLRQDVQRSLARIAFDEGRYEDALEALEHLRELAPDDPEILLEMAWTHFYQGDSRKALGLLVALDAPVHETYIAPERYLLEAMALRRLCQFGAARQAAVRLERRYGPTLAELGEGKLPGEVKAIRDAARQRGLAKAPADFHDRLLWERKRLDSLRLDKGLKERLEDQYERGLREASMREEAALGRELDQLTEEFLSAQEGVRLIVHELGVSLLRGRRRPPGAQEVPEVDIPPSGTNVFYQFDGEYWTDELDDLVVVAEDRCAD